MNRSFAAFLSAQTLSAFGDAISLVAVPLLILRGGGTVGQVGAVTGLSALATLLTGIFAGHVADRFDRKLLLRLCDVARCGLYAAIPLTGGPLWLVLTVVPLAAVFSMLFQVTYVTVVPGLVPVDRITEANGRLYSAYAVAALAGPAVAGFLSGLTSPAAAIAVDAGTFALSAALLSFVRMRPVPPVPDSGGLAAGVRFIRHHPVLLPLTVLLTVVLAVTSALDDVVIYHLTHDLRQPDGVVGTVMTAAVVGSLVASMVVAWLRRRAGFGPLWIGAYTLAGLCVAAVGFSRQVAVVAVLAAVVLLCSGVAGIASMSLRQEVTPAHLLGRVTAAFWTLQLTLAPLGAAGLTAAAGQWGVPATLAAGGAAVTLTALSALFTPMRRTVPPPPPPT
ncbi:MFS transporter [Dactylosporangium sucinum]|uniref:MFS transporter n=1 Tax=Dactylosporangium sucinum TaxID=1424081 RepID=A0A917X3M8_9ACTN|nr:MFS transporter [Dactylosporangium sucinum]GGM61392.1 MFS transporter [Dactylosporangium sucinum]